MGHHNQFIVQSGQFEPYLILWQVVAQQGGESPLKPAI